MQKSEKLNALAEAGFCTCPPHWTILSNDGAGNETTVHYGQWLEGKGMPEYGHSYTARNQQEKYDLTEKFRQVIEEWV